MNTMINADCLEYLKGCSDNYVDSMVSDPPAGISFMGKKWDDDKGGRKQWIAWMTEVMEESLRVMKPGAHGLVWAIPRTSHWTATALEDAGFEIRDVVTHLFGTGFPKSHNISKSLDKLAGAEREVVGQYKSPEANTRSNTTSSDSIIGTGNRLADAMITAPATPEAKQWDGWGTALKPASEHWILIRKPLAEKTVAKNVLKYGTGGINIDESRIESKPRKTGTVTGGDTPTGTGSSMMGSSRSRQIEYDAKDQGRFPANVVLDEEAAELLDEQSGVLKSGARNGVRKARESPGGGFKEVARDTGKLSASSEGGASRFFYVAKASKRDKGADNTHPTVKNTKLMEYLIKLITPPNGTVLDPFMGSGSTGVAAVRLDFDFIGIEKELEYYNIAKDRIINDSVGPGRI